MASALMAWTLGPAVLALEGGDVARQKADSGFGLERAVRSCW